MIRVPKAASDRPSEADRMIAMQHLEHLGRGEHLIAVGTAVSSRPPHRSVREYTNSYGSSFRSGVKPDVWPRVDDTRFWQMNSHQPSHSRPSPLAPLLTASTNLTKPKMEDCITKLLKPSTIIRHWSTNRTVPPHQRASQSSQSQSVRHHLRCQKYKRVRR